VVLGEQITLVQVGGAAVILTGVYLIQRSEKPVASASDVTTQVIK
jgi:drug/metabolite transporter (DMT)-like permease